MHWQNIHIFVRNSHYKGKNSPKDAKFWPKFYAITLEKRGKTIFAKQPK